ncbi:MAG: hybrid sensor histidine kinase/response regulator [Methanomicrobiales archaeon]|nr:hybrid sensor histidine kinase/response regulator [Methanomicrobiales archaeon]
MNNPSSLPILIVEDNRTQAEFLRYILEREGYQILLSSNGNEALCVIEKTRPSLILTDIMMPEMDGYELCYRIKIQKDMADIPVILVTHLYDPVDIIRGLEAGADNFIIKPYTPEIILTTVEKLVQQEYEKTPEWGEKPLCITYNNQSYRIHATTKQIINILLSTYEVAIHNNADLHETQEKLHYLNDQMQKTLSELQQTNADLSIENQERKLVETALENANNKLQLMASITRHDLLNQLNSLQGYFELATMERTANQQDAWTYIDKAWIMLQKTISTVKFTREYQEIGIKNPVWHNCRHLIDKSLQYISLDQVSLVNAIPYTLEIFADPLIEKVFSNLIDNAVRYGGKISKILVTYEEHEGTKQIIIQDDGLGILPEEKEIIFQYQYGKNTGLGLFLSREILLITRITIRERGVLGEGARFEILLPDDTIRFVEK